MTADAEAQRLREHRDLLARRTEKVEGELLRLRERILELAYVWEDLLVEADQWAPAELRAALLLDAEADQ